MTFPIDIHIGSIIIPSHFIFEVLGFYIAYKYYIYLSSKKSDPLSENHRWLIIIGGAFGALIGSRLLAALERPYLFLHPPSFLFYYENQTIAGGIIGALLGVEIIKWIIGEKKRSGDIFTYPLILGIMVGRVGCFLTGIKDATAGLPCNLVWCFNQGDAIPRHPTALYEILFLGLLWIALYKTNNRIVFKNGTLFRLFVIGYTTFRFCVEFIKPIQSIAFGLSAIQIACLCIAIFYILTLIIPSLKYKLKKTNVEV